MGHCCESSLSFSFVDSQMTSIYYCESLLLLSCLVSQMVAFVRNSDKMDYSRIHYTCSS